MIIETELSNEQQQEGMLINGVGTSGRRPVHFDRVLLNLNEPSIEEAEVDRASSYDARVPVWKRIFDIVCIVATVPFWLPIMIAIGLWVRIVSPGPIFFRQERVGYRRKPFRILKFRTMKVNVETVTHELHLERLMQSDAPMTKLDAAGDPRIIKGGRILRATGLDELPQLLNVLLGEMSLVGPRPCTQYEFERYQTWQKARVNAPPGLTGYWQVNGKNKTTFTEMIKLDIYYTKHMSVWLDLLIMLKTFPTVLLHVWETRINKRVQKASHKTVMGQYNN